MFEEGVAQSVAVAIAAIVERIAVVLWFICLVLSLYMFPVLIFFGVWRVGYRPNSFCPLRMSSGEMK